jgi:hypothetical protein
LAGLTLSAAAVIEISLVSAIFATKVSAIWDCGSPIGSARNGDTGMSLHARFKNSA